MVESPLVACRVTRVQTQLVFVQIGILMSLLATRLMLFALHTSIPLNWVLIFYLYKLITCRIIFFNDIENKPMNILA